jgi:dCTP deaminase
MILSDIQILRHLEEGSIKIEPFVRSCLGSNSYDVHLGDTLAVHVDNHGSAGAGVILDAKAEPRLQYLHIPDEGVQLLPGILYLGATLEYTETHGLVPWIDGKSSVGRLGISIHATAGRGDAGWCNHWTLEISCIQPVYIYKGMPIGQITYFTTGEVGTPYNEKGSAKYNGRTSKPIGSAMWKNFDKATGKWK